MMCMCICIWGVCECKFATVDIRGQLLGAGYLFSLWIPEHSLSGFFLKEKEKEKPARLFHQP